MSFLKVIFFFIVISGCLKFSLPYKVVRKAKTFTSIRISFYRYLANDKHRSQIEIDEYNHHSNKILIDKNKESASNEVNKFYFRNRIFSRENIFMSLLSGKAGLDCYGKCNEKIPYYRSFRSSSEIEVLNSAKNSGFFLKFIMGLKANYGSSCFKPCSHDDDCTEVCTVCNLNRCEREF
jgi:hypothetical protein